jgi:hypothetical protein
MRFFRRKDKKERIDLDDAVERFVAHCMTEGQKMEAAFRATLTSVLDGLQGRPTLAEVLQYRLVTFERDNAWSHTTSLFSAHCQCIALAMGMSHKNCASDRMLIWRIAHQVSAREVGPDRVGHTPNPRPTPDMHVLYEADALTGGVDSRLLALVKRYRRLRSAEERLCLICLALRIVPVSEGVGIAIYEEAPGFEDDVVKGYNLVGYRRATLEEVDEWVENIAILDPTRILAPLAAPARRQMLESISAVDPFWPSFFEKFRPSWHWWDS